MSPELYQKFSLYKLNSNKYKGSANFKNLHWEFLIFEIAYNNHRDTVVV